MRDILMICVWPEAFVMMFISDYVIVCCGILVHVIYVLFIKKKKKKKKKKKNV